MEKILKKASKETLREVHGGRHEDGLHKLLPIPFEIFDALDSDVLPGASELRNCPSVLCPQVL